MFRLKLTVVLKNITEGKLTTTCSGSCHKWYNIQYHNKNPINSAFNMVALDGGIAGLLYTQLQRHSSLLSVCACVCVCVLLTISVPIM